MKLKHLNLILAMLLVAVTGCASQNKDMQTDADKAAAKDPFETQGDPPINTNTHFAAGQVAEVQGNLPNAISQYKQALAKDPNHQPSVYRMAVIYTQTKQYNEAIDAWKQYIEMTGKSAEGYSNIGLAYMLNNQPDLAESSFKSGVQADPKNERVRMNYGLMLAKQNRINEARIQLQAVLPPAKVHYNIGSVYEQLGRREEARNEYAKALQEDPTFQDAKVRAAALK